MAWRFLNRKVEQAEKHLTGSDILLREIAEVVLELRANTENLEDILKRWKEDDDDEL